MRKRENILVVDVRSAGDYASGHVDGAVNIPIGDLAERSKELPRKATIVTVCNAGGNRCRNAAAQLTERGFKAQPLRGGTKGWLGKE